MNHLVTKAARLEARISEEQKELFQHAASLLGKTLTDFAVSVLQNAAKDVIKEHKVIQLSLEDQKLFVESVFNPSKSSKVLLSAAKRYKKRLETKVPSQISLIYSLDL